MWDSAREERVVPLAFVALKQVDLIIIGQGLAGCALAWQAWFRGTRPLIVESDLEPGRRCSRVAAGLLNPVRGRGEPKPVWRAAEMVETASVHYQQVASHIGRRVFHPTVILRHPASETPGQSHPSQGLENQAEGISRELVDEISPGPPLHVRNGGWLDTAAYIDATRTFFQERGLYLNETYRECDTKFGKSARDVVCWRDYRAKALIVAAGLAARKLPSFSSLPFRAAAGRIAEIECPSPAPSDEIHVFDGHWLIKRAAGPHLCGATYEFVDPESVPNEFPDELLPLTNRILGPAWECSHIRVGVRPILRQSRPLMGRHPRIPTLAWLNGLGSRGVSTAPRVASALLDHLLLGEELDAEFDASRCRHVHQFLQ